MLRTCLRISVLGTSLIALASPAGAQEIVHALTGTVSAINPAQKSVTVFEDGGSTDTFKMMASSKAQISFDKKLESEVTSAQQFQQQGAYVILFYYGLDQNKTAVALKSLGKGPFSSTSGNVTSWDSHSHKLVVTGKDGSTHTFAVDSQSVAETYRGAVNGSEFRPDKGDRIRVVSTVKDGTPTVLFVTTT